MFANLPVRVYLDVESVVRGYDFYDTSSRTGTVTRFFNIQVGKLNESLFEFPE